MYKRKRSCYKPVVLALMLILTSIILAACFPLEATPVPVSTNTPNTAIPTTTYTPTPALTSSPIPTPTLTPTSTPTSTPLPTPEMIERTTPDSSNLIERQYEWSFDRREWTWSMEVPQPLYDYYRQLPRPPTQDYSVYVTHPQDDFYLEMLTEKIINASNEAHFDRWETVNFAAAFVQSLPYTLDNVSTSYDEYPRYPIETLMDNGGDCEDTSILMAALLEQLGYDNVLLVLPDHMAVGVLSDEGVNGYYFVHNSGKYYYLETTGEGWSLGEIPPEHESQSAQIYDIVPVSILTHKWDATYLGYDWTITATVENLGTAAAQGVVIETGFDAGNDLLWNLKQSEPFDLSSGYTITVTIYQAAPPNVHTRLMMQIIDDGYSVDESYSEWLDTN